MLHRQANDGAKHTILVGVQTRTTDIESAAFATRDFAVNEIEVDVGIGGITFDGTDKLEVELTYSADGVAAYAAVTDSGHVLLDGAAVDPDSGGVVKAFVAAHAAAARYVLTILTPGWYKLKFEFSGTHGTGTPLAATLRQSCGRLNPPL
jgi:hypothetical protein